MLAQAVPLILRVLLPQAVLLVQAVLLAHAVLLVHAILLASSALCPLALTSWPGSFTERSKQFAMLICSVPAARSLSVALQ